jgi:hypothetical protein
MVKSSTGDVSDLDGEGCSGDDGMGADDDISGLEVSESSPF